MPLECFYTLPERIEEHRVSWRIHARLRRHVDLLCEKIHPVEYLVQDPQEAACARYLFEQLRKHPEDELMHTHWIAFLQRRCEIVAKRILPLIGAHHQTVVGFQDLFLMASSSVIDPRQFFKNFDESHVQQGYWYPTLVRFTDIKIKHFLLPQLRRITGTDMFGRSNLGLVARSTRSQVKEALQRLSYSEAQIYQYLLAWQCFQEYRNSVNRGVNRFRTEDFQTIAELYNERREQLDLAEATSTVRGSEIETWLDRIADAIRRLLDPPRDSLHTRLYLHSDEETSLLENIPYESRFDREMYQTIGVLRVFIADLLTGLQQIKEKQVLFLKCGLELNQTQVGQEVGGQQYGISRLSVRLKKRIFSEILKWFNPNQNIEPSSNELKNLEALLCHYYAEQIDRCFARSINFLGQQSRELLRLVYVVKLTEAEIADRIHMSTAEVVNILQAMRQWLCNSMTEQIQTEIQLQFQFQGAATQRIPALIETRLETILQLYL